MYALAPLALSLVFANAAAAAAFSSPVLGLNVLAARQSAVDPSDIPSECRSSCDGPLSTIDTCQTSATDATCICNGKFAGGLVSCFNCFIRVDKEQRTVDGIQAQYDLIKDQCASAGENFADHTFTLAGANGACRAAALTGPALVGVGAAVLAGLL